MSELKESTSIFSIKGAIGRWKYFYINTLMIGIITLLLLLTAVLINSFSILIETAHTTFITILTIYLIATVIVVIFTTYIIIAAMIKRIADITSSTKLSIIIFILLTVLNSALEHFNLNTISSYLGYIVLLFLILKKGKIIIPTPFEITAKQKREVIALIIIFIMPLSVLFIKQIESQRYVVSDGMAPTIVKNDRLWINKISKSFNRGDVVVYKAPMGNDYVQRIIGIPGDKIEIKIDKNQRGSVFVNDKLYTESYIKNTTKYIPCDEKMFCKILNIPENKYFLLGDNREISKDSRYLGLIDKKDIIGKAAGIFWPLARINILSHSSDLYKIQAESDTQSN